MGQETAGAAGRGVCVDTSVVIELLRRSKAILTRLANVQRSPYIASVTVFELLLRKTNIEPVNYFVSGVQILDFDAAAARTASEVAKKLKSRGVSVEIRDLFIAATAMSNNCELATLNRKDFEKIEGLKLLDF
ncbi:type II toxin-antitoxin system VapC family toxin [Candidatus Woesearchaeota archaeon]|nr:type II toxin-antitoxin system VapC family toxin [Candidatus Woesearchaeota archaeon]